MVLVGGLLLAALGNGPWVWALGVVTLTYEVALLLRITALARMAVHRPPSSALVDAPQPTLAVLIAARNEAKGLPTTLAALAAAQDPPEDVVVIDDGSTDGTHAAIAARWPLELISEDVWRGTTWPALRVLRQVGAGKATALNRGLGATCADVVLTLDADTQIESTALVAVRRAFAQAPDLVAACGVLEPVTASASWFWSGFQRLEYLRSFLWRLGWARRSSLVLVSGAFAAFRLDALRAVGGFDATSLVEDYEVIYRLHDQAVRAGCGPALTTVIGTARAVTDVPVGLRAFARQRRRWFAGFVRTLAAYRHLVGDRAAGLLGRRHLVVKTIDMLLPALGIAAWLALGILALRSSAVAPEVWLLIAAVIGGRMLIEAVVGTWCWRLYRRWQGRAPLAYRQALPLLLLEGICFQPLRQACAVLGCLDVLRGRRGW